MAIALTAGIVSFGERLTLALPVLTVAATVWRVRLPRRQAVATLVAVVLTSAVWLAAEPLLSRAGGEGTRAQLGGVSETDTGRATAWRATFRGWTERPWWGWGPGSTKTAYLRGATPAEVEDAGRGWSDAHDLFLETLVSSGPVALAAVLALMGVLTIRGLRSPPSRGWAVGAAAALGVFALLQPISAVLTPLLFLFGGMAGDAPRLGDPAPAWRFTVGTGLAAALVVTSITLASATLERWGTTYGETWALESSIDLQPWRESARQVLALQLAVDSRGGRTADAARARELIDETVASYPWDADARLWAAQSAHLMGDDGAAIAWIDEHVERFPADIALAQQVRDGIGRGFLIPDAGQTGASGD